MKIRLLIAFVAKGSSASPDEGDMTNLDAYLRPLKAWAWAWAIATRSSCALAEPL